MKILTILGAIIGILAAVAGILDYMGITIAKPDVGAGAVPVNVVIEIPNLSEGSKANTQIERPISEVKPSIEQIENGKSLNDTLLVMPLDFSNYILDYSSNVLSNLAQIGQSKLQHAALNSKQFNVSAVELRKYIHKEIEYSKTGAVSEETALEYGHIHAASWVLVGKIEELSAYTHNYNYDGLNINTRRVTIGISVQLFDMKTGLAKWTYSDTQNSKQTIDSQEKETQIDTRLFRKSLGDLIDGFQKKFTEFRPDYTA